MEKYNDMQHQKITGKFIEVRSMCLHHEGTNDYTKDKTIIEDIVDKTGQKVEPSWEKSWKEVAPGIKTCVDSDDQCVRVYRKACPVRVKFQSYHEYGEYENSGGYTDFEDSFTNSRYYWVQYERGMGAVMKKIFYLSAAALLVACAVFIYGQHQHRLLWQGLDNVEKVKVIYYGSNYHLGGGSANILYAEKDKDLISELYKRVTSIKNLELHINPDEDESQESDPLFEIVFYYKDGKGDIIESTETGKYIFRRLLGSGWVGGPSDDILVIINKLQVPAHGIRKKTEWIRNPK